MKDHISTEKCVIRNLICSVFILTIKVSDSSLVYNYSRIKG